MLTADVPRSRHKTTAANLLDVESLLLLVVSLNLCHFEGRFVYFSTVFILLVFNFSRSQWEQIYEFTIKLRMQWKSTISGVSNDSFLGVVVLYMNDSTFSATKADAVFCLVAICPPQLVLLVVSSSRPYTSFLYTDIAQMCNVYTVLLFILNVWLVVGGVQ